MAINLGHIRASLQLNHAVEARNFTRILYFKNHDEHGVRIKLKFHKQDELTYISDEMTDGKDSLIQILNSNDRSYLDHPRLLNRGGNLDLDIRHFTFDCKIDVNGKSYDVTLLDGIVNEILEDERRSININSCVTGIRAELACLLADLDGFKTPFQADSEKLLRAFEEIKNSTPPTLYNNIQNGKRYGWALSSREGAIDDIHGRRYSKYGLESEFSTPTSLYQGYLKKILEELAPKVGPIYRARFIGIEGYREILPHHDGHDGTRFYRYHFPIIPNPQCVFNVAGNDFVMDKVGQLYQFAAWKTHSVVNYDGPRVHLLFSGERSFL